MLIMLNAVANNMLIQNVTTTGNNAAAKTIQLQFDMSWDNSWRDSLNWDAAWVFIKFKDANGLWQHAQLNQSGFANGSGTANTVKVTSDKIGCWVYRSALGSGTFNATSMQLQWNYGLSGLADVTGLEVRMFSAEMVYVPVGEFNCAKSYSLSIPSFNDYKWSWEQNFYASGKNNPVINERLSPIFTHNENQNIRIKGNSGIDTDADGLVDNLNYPTGYNPFYALKYELTEQQYADFLNTLTANQRTTLGVAGTGITLSNGQYFSSSPNKACVKSNVDRLLSYADWAGIRPISFTEFNKASYGPMKPVLSNGYWLYPAWGTDNQSSGHSIDSVRNVGIYATSTSGRSSSGASYYGLMDLTGNAREPVVDLNFLTFSIQNGNGSISDLGFHDVEIWSLENMIVYVDQIKSNAGFSTDFSFAFRGFRYCRSAE